MGRYLKHPDTDLRVSEGEPVKPPKGWLFDWSWMNIVQGKSKDEFEMEQRRLGWIIYGWFGFLGVVMVVVGVVGIVMA